ncbi:hypothetical protein FB567DRAFT_579320 [Paraphoma chrysanthemicola]|uniref:Chitin-binding type-1 domain-containing protein n=1 Tax=Paraphoma chrysanthemicola TaxID=798071 RepID=A0A8K0R9G0_9PLEO|nr:hypothetical protein FB567DRAFT_579320 [Paraphoma chrysanthemicola]
MLSFAFAASAFVLLGFSQPSTAENTITFNNKCPYDVFYWTVPPGGQAAPGIIDSEWTKVPALGTHTYLMPNGVALGGGSAIKVRDLPRYQVKPAGIIQFEHNVQTEKLWYDMSVIDCNAAVGPEDPSFCPLIGGGVKMFVHNQGEGEDCQTATCNPDGTCERVYFNHGHWLNEPSLSCRSGADITIEFCKDRVGPRTKGIPELDGVPPPVGPLNPIFSSPGHPRPDASHVRPPHVVSSPKPTPSGPLILSPDGTCGGTTGFKCEGSIYGNCCSKWGFCGNSPEHCDAGCQSGFGFCSSSKSSSPVSAPSGSKTSIIKQYGPKSSSSVFTTSTIVTRTSSHADLKSTSSSIPTTATRTQATTSTYTAHKTTFSTSSTQSTSTVPIPLPSSYAPVEKPAPESPEPIGDYSSPPSYSAAPPPKPVVKISPNGLCGVTTGFTCGGSNFGNCCSEYNYCGSTPAYCSGGCQSEFGDCDTDDEDLAKPIAEYEPESEEVESVEEGPDLEQPEHQDEKHKDAEPGYDAGPGYDAPPPVKRRESRAERLAALIQQAAHFESDFLSGLDSEVEVLEFDSGS